VELNFTDDGEDFPKPKPKNQVNKNKGPKKNPNAPKDVGRGTPMLSFNPD